MDWLAEAVNTVDQTQTSARETTRKRYDADLHRLQARLDTLYEDRLDNRITKAFYDHKRADIEAQADEVRRKITALEDATLPPLTTAVDIARLTSDACNAFRDQTEPEQRALLTTVLKSATWKDAQLHTTLLEPFEQLRRSNQPNTNGINGNGGPERDFAKWLPSLNPLRTFSVFWCSSPTLAD